MRREPQLSRRAVAAAGCLFLSGCLDFTTSAETTATVSTGSAEGKLADTRSSATATERPDAPPWTAQLAAPGRYIEQFESILVVSTDSTVYGFDPKTGSVRWTAAVPTASGGPIVGRSNTTVYVQTISRSSGPSETALCAYNLDSGELMHRFNLDRSLVGTDTVFGVFAHRPIRYAAFDIASRQKKWSRNIGLGEGYIRASAQLQDAIFLVGESESYAQSDGRELRAVCVETESGAVRWQLSHGEIPYNDHRDVASISTGRGSIVLGTSGGYLVSIAANDGSIQWRRRFDGSQDSPDPIHPATVYDDVLIAVEGAGRWLAAINPDTGETEWLIDQLGTAPFVTALNDRLYLWLNGRGIGVVDPENGELVKTYEQSAEISGEFAVSDTAFYYVDESAVLHAENVS